MPRMHTWRTFFMMVHDKRYATSCDCHLELMVRSVKKLESPLPLLVCNTTNNRKEALNGKDKLQSFLNLLVVVKLHPSPSFAEYEIAFTCV